MIGLPVRIRRYFARPAALMQFFVRSAFLFFIDVLSSMMNMLFGFIFRNLNAEAAPFIVDSASTFITKMCKSV